MGEGDTRVSLARLFSLAPTTSKRLLRRLVEDQTIDIESTLKILGVTMDKNLSYKSFVDILLKNA